jgi:3-oxoacyl-[acyl-carrier protein] reductase
MGRVIATHMANLGANVAVHGTTPLSTRAFNEADSLEAVAKAIATEHGVDVLPVHGDLSDESTVKSIAKQIREKFGPMDIVVNNAGGDIGSQGTFKETRNEGGGLKHQANNLGGVPNKTLVKGVFRWKNM